MTRYLYAALAFVVLTASAPAETITPGEVGLASGLLAGVGGKGPEEKPKAFPVLVVKRGDFVLLALPEGKAGLESIMNTKKSIAAKLQPVQEWLDKQDMSGV